MRDSVPSTRYSSVCNVLRQWNISLIPTYRVGRLYDNVSSPPPPRRFLFISSRRAMIKVQGTAVSALHSQNERERTKVWLKQLQFAL